MRTTTTPMFTTSSRTSRVALAIGAALVWGAAPGAAGAAPGGSSTSNADTGSARERAVVNQSQEQGALDTVSESGRCSADSTWSISARSRTLRVKLIVELSGGQPGEKWGYSIGQNDARLARGLIRTRGYGIARARASANNQPGVDTFTVAARNRTSGETCRGTLSY